MYASFALRTPGETPARRFQSYDDLRRSAARYARDHLAGLTLTNRATQLGITLTPHALKEATSDGSPPALLRAIPALPTLLSQAGYVRSTPDRRDHVDIRRVDLGDTRREHLLTATADIAGRPVTLFFAVRENFGGQCFLDRVIDKVTSTRHRRGGGGLPDENGGDETASTEATGSTAAPPDPETSPDASSSQYAARQTCAAGHNACIASGRSSKDCLMALNICRQGIPTIFAPGIWGASG